MTSNLRELLIRKAQADEWPETPDHTGLSETGKRSSVSKPADNNKASLSLSQSLLELVPSQAGSHLPVTSYQSFKTRIHNRLIEIIDIAALMQVDGSKT